MRRASRTAIAAVMALTVGTAPVRAQGLPDDITVRMAGAGAIGGKLIQALATAWAGKLGLTGVRVNAGTTPEEYEVAASRAEGKQRLRVVVLSRGTMDGAEPFMRGTNDFWMVTRPLKESDLETQRKKGVPGVPTLQQVLSPAAENLIGLDPVVNIVNARNPVKVLTFAQMKDMYSGKVTNWSQLGGASLPVQPTSFEAVTGSAVTFCDRALGIPDASKCIESMKLGFPLQQTSQDMADTVAANPGAVGFVAYADRRNAKPVPIGTECGTTVEASAFRVKAGEYPMVIPLYLYSNPTRPQSPAARAFLDFVHSTAGQAVVAKAGKVDLAPSAAPDSYGDDRLERVRDAQDGGRTRIRPLDARAFEEATNNATRLSVTFRFQAGTAVLDSRGEADVARFVQVMQEDTMRDQQVVLIGFSGASGDYGEGRALSRDRASTMRDRLLALGVKDITAIGVGPAAAVACNLDPDAAILNQRVEVWLRKRG